MKVYVKKTYYKHSKIGREPVSYKAKQPNGKGTTVYAKLKIDPILRKKRARDLRDGIMRHEMNEIKVWGKGSTRPHKVASAKEPRLTHKLGGASGFWKQVHKRGLI